jgi:hypothetical protein
MPGEARRSGRFAHFMVQSARGEYR